MSIGLRALGVLPLAIFVAYLIVAIYEHRAADSLWMCHLTNLLLGCALLMNRPTLVRIAAIWSVFGLPLWLFDIWATREVSTVSAVSHVGAVGVGLYALAKIRMSRNPWLYGILIYLAVQTVCRWITDPALNVNIAHHVYRGSEAWFGRYDVYWLTTTTLAALCLWAVGRLLMLAFPPFVRERGENRVGDALS